MGKKRAASEGSEDSLIAKKPKQSKTNTKPSVGDRSTKKDADGNEYWEIADKRRATISQFKNQHLVSIREYYEQNGEMKPGKKGISLTVAQLTAFIEVLPAIEASLKAAGKSIPRPEYEQGSRQVEDEDVEVPDAGAESMDVKKNFEETSEEE